MENQFTTDYQSIKFKINQIDPILYGLNRNYIDGAVTYLSPYIARGVISTKQVLDVLLLKGYKINDMIPFVKELCWRDYFQRVAQHKEVNKDIKQVQTRVSNKEISKNIIDGKSGIHGIDIAIQELYQSGYMHNHSRMYVASLVCNICNSHWLKPSKWLYYHLLDGDFASNQCSWQWVAGTNSSKKYFANQENINKFTHTNQKNTFLDASYEQIESMETPNHLLENTSLELICELPPSDKLVLDENQPTFIYNYYNLDPVWHKGESGNRILLLDPTVFEEYPISPKCIEFMMNLSKNIPEIQVFVGTFDSFTAKFNPSKIFFKEHPLNFNFKGIEESRDWIDEEVAGYYPSFFAYWKVLEKKIMK